MDKRVILLGFAVVLLSYFAQPSYAGPWNGAFLCPSNYAGGAGCYGSTSYSGSVSLTGDLNLSGNVVINPGATLFTNGYSITTGGTFDNLGTLVGGSANNGGAASGSSPNTAAGGSGSYGIFIQAYGIIAGTVDLDGGNGGPSHSLSNGGNGGYQGGATYPGTNAGTAGGGSGSSVVAPSVTNLLLKEMYSAGMVNYLTGAGGGTGGGQSGSNGQSYANSYGGSGGGGGGSACNSGTCNGGNGGGGGAGSVIFAYGAGGLTGGTYEVSGGVGGSGAGFSGGAGGSGTVTSYSYGNTQPLTTPFIDPQVANVLPRNVLATTSVSFTVNLIQTTNPIKNYTIFWGDATNNIVTTSSTSNVISHTYPYGGNPHVYNISVYVCDILSNCNDSFTNSISTYYYPPTFSSINPTRNLEANSVVYTINTIAGSFTTKNTIVYWGDGTFNVITSSSSSVTASHTYAYVNDPKPDTFAANVVVCDINSVCTTTSANIIGIYNVPQINGITPAAATYSTLSNSFTFNIIRGNYSVTVLQVIWGDGTSNFVSINSLTPSVSHAYSLAGNYVIQAIALDQNSAPSNAFSANVQVLQYVLPSISAITPTAVYSANSIAFNFTDAKGSFNIQSINSIVINFGNGNTVYISNSVTGRHSVSFTYPNNGNYSVIETITDTNGYQGFNTTLINVGAFPWSFTTPTPVIYYNVTNVTTQKLVQTNQTDNLPVAYALQDQNIVNDYICSSSISNSGLFSISCVTNPNVFSYTNQTLVVAIYAQDTHGAIKQVLETIHLTPKSPPPVPPVTPFSTNTVTKPLNSPQFIPLNGLVITGILSMALIMTVVSLYITRKGK